MADYNITLSEEMNVALQYALELSGSPSTMEEMLQARVDSDLLSVLRNLDSVLSVALSNLTALQSDTASFNAVMATIESEAMKARILQLLS